MVNFASELFNLPRAVLTRFRAFVIYPPRLSRRTSRAVRNFDFSAGFPIGTGPFGAGIISPRVMSPLCLTLKITHDFGRNVLDIVTTQHGR